MFDVHASGNFIFVFPCFKFPKDVLDIPFSVNEQDFSRREHFPVNRIAKPGKNPCNQNLNKSGRRKIVYRNQPVVHQGKLRIGYGVYKKKRKYLRQKYIHGFQVSYLRPPVGIIKKDQQHHIN